MTDPVPLLAMTPEQQRQWEVDGFFVCADFLSADEVQRLLAAIDAVAAEHATATGGLPEAGFQVRNLLAHGDAFLDLVDHPRMLPLVVDAIGTDIQIRTSHLDIRPQYPEGLEAGGIGMGDGADAKAGQRNMGWHPDLAPQTSLPLKGGPAEDHIPFMEMKVFYVLSDMRESNCGNLWLAPGSHRRPRGDLAALQAAGEQPPDARELRLAPGSAVVWRTACWHCVGPQLSPATRKIIHIGYHHRWLRPTDYERQDEALLAGCNPVRRQLLGSLPEGRDSLGDESVWSPASKYWQPSADDVPLRAWSEEFRNNHRPTLAGLSLPSFVGALAEAPEVTAPFVAGDNRHGTPYTVLPDWIDANGHMNVARYIDVFDEASFTTFFDAIGLGRSFFKIHGKEGYTSMTLQSNVRYSKEILEGAVFEVRCQILNFDERFLQYSMELWHTHDVEGEGGEYLVSTCERISICANLKTRGASGWPKPVLDGFGAWWAQHKALPFPGWAGDGGAIGIRSGGERAKM